jgi:hypothetical protein
MRDVIVIIQPVPESEIDTPSISELYPTMGHCLDLAVIIFHITTTALVINPGPGQKITGHSG